MAKIAPYNNVACAITNERAVDMKAFHKNILKKEQWVDIRKFVSKGKRELSDGLFEIFGNYSNESPHTVHDNLCGWIYDNFRQIETWFSIALKQKGISLMNWTENLRNPKQPGDELCLYLLCRMYRRHTLVHLIHHWWCTIQHILPGDLNEILDQCHLELVFVREWVFGEVKQIRKPKTPLYLNQNSWTLQTHRLLMKASHLNRIFAQKLCLRKDVLLYLKMPVQPPQLQRKSARYISKNYNQRHLPLLLLQTQTWHTTCVPDHPNLQLLIEPQIDHVQRWITVNSWLEMTMTHHLPAKGTLWT